MTDSERERHHSYTPELVCPHCLYEHRDSYEWSPRDEDGDGECYDCGKNFRWSRHIRITYSTRKD